MNPDQGRNGSGEDPGTLNLISDQYARNMNIHVNTPTHNTRMPGPWDPDSPPDPPSSTHQKREGMSRTPPSGSTAATVPPTPGGSRRAEVIARAAGTLEEAFTETGRLSTHAIKATLNTAFESHDGGGWESADAHEACEVAMTRFLLRHGRAIGQAGRNSEKTDRRIQTIAEREPRIRGRSRRHDRLQHYATPLEIAWAMAVAADIDPNETVLDPSAGTGILTAMAHIAQPEAVLRATEGDLLRAELLMLAVPGVETLYANAISVERHQGGWHDTHDVILLNPPFSARIGSDGRHRHEDLVHLMAARRATVRHGRIVALLGGGTTPHGNAWEKTVNGELRIIWSAWVNGTLMRNRETQVSSLLCVLENADEDYAYNPERDAERYDDAQKLVAAARTATGQGPTSNGRSSSGRTSP